MEKTKIVIIGGGFGGVYTARYLDKLLGKKVEITLINKSNYFLFTPLLHEVATGGLTQDSIVEPIREVFRGENISFVEDSVIEVKKETKEVLTSRVTYSYDYLVISTGAETNYFGIPGAKEHTFTLKNLQDAIAMRNHIIETFEKAIATKNKDLLSFAVIGAGATGIELVAELAEYVRDTLCVYYKDSGLSREDVKVTMLTNLPEILTVFPSDMRKIALAELKKKGIDVKVNTTVVKVDSHLITFSDNTNLSSHTIIWVAGVKPSVLEIKGLEAGQKGRIDTNEYLQTIKHPEIFALGDAGGSSPMLAQVAVQQAKVVARNIDALIDHTPLTKFTFFQKGLLISIGQWYAVGHFLGLTFKGRLMWLLWRAIYLVNFLSLRKKIEIAFEWTVNFFYPRDITYIK